MMFTRVIQISLVTFFLLFLFACATPVGVNKVETSEIYRNIYTSALSDDVISSDTTILMKRYNLLDGYEKNTDAVIAQLHDKALTDTRRDILFALSELSFFHGERLAKASSSVDADLLSEYSNLQEWGFLPDDKITTDHDRGPASDYYLMSALYAYLYLFSKTGEEPPGAYDRRFRLASDLYNRALALGLVTGKNGELEFKEGIRRLPIGEIAISVNKESLGLPMEQFESFLPADDYVIRGLTVRNRTAGLGSPLIATKKKTKALPRVQAMPVTAFLNVDADLHGVSDKTAKASLELYSAYEETEASVNGVKVPLETDSTTPIAYQLNNAPIWKLGLHSFLSPGQQKSELYVIQPYQKGRIPVVFVHGTASSPVWWGEMWNTLSADPVLRKHFQYAFFFYNSSVPVASSASDLRRILSETVSRLDPEGKDMALQKMVIIGHSQGGLLTKLSVVRPEGALWRSISDKNIEDLKTLSAVKSQLRNWMYFEPLPFVKRVVYIATPFRGSFRAQGWVRSFIRRIVSLPLNILSLPMDIAKKDPNVISELMGQMKLPFELRNKIPTSIDSMSPLNPVLQTLAKMPVVPGVKTHSIIAIDGDDKPPNGNDGVVEYKSASQEGVESEYIVRSFHSCQGHPLVIEEVRRILLEHLESVKSVPETGG